MAGISGVPEPVPRARSGHAHEPDPAKTRSLRDYPPDLLDPDAYPLLGECQECQRAIRCERQGAPWQTPEEYAGVPEEWGGTRYMDDDGGGTVRLPRTEGNSGPPPVSPRTDMSRMARLIERTPRR